MAGQSGRLIGGIVATLANMLNPQLIVLAVSIAHTNDIPMGLDLLQSK